MSSDKPSLEEAVLSLTMRVTVLEKLLISKNILSDSDFTGELEKIVEHLKELSKLASEKDASI